MIFPDRAGPPDCFECVTKKRGVKICAYQCESAAIKVLTYSPTLWHWLKQAQRNSSSALILTTMKFPGYVRTDCKRLADQSFIFIVVADPKPIEDALLAPRQRATITGYSDAPEFADLFEMKRGMARVLTKTNKLLVSGTPRRQRECAIEAPELGRRPRFRQRDSSAISTAVTSATGIGRNLPSRTPARTFSTRACPRPPGEKSRFICRSQSSMLWRFSHAPSAARSLSGKPPIASFNVSRRELILLDYRVWQRAARRPISAPESSMTHRLDCTSIA